MDMLGGIIVYMYIFTTSSIFLYGIEAQNLIGPSPANQAVLFGTTHTLACSRSPGGAAGYISWDESLTTRSRRTIFLDDIKQSQNDKYINFSIDSDGKDQFNLVITNITIGDEGTYICRHVVEGEEISATRTVEVRATPCVMSQNGSKIDKVTMTTGEPSEITCTALGSRPVVNIDWYHQMNGKSNFTRITTGVTQTNTSNDDDTYNTISTLRYTASEDYYRGRLRCLTSGQEVAEPWDVSVPLNVKYSPNVTVHIKDNTIICQADANPDVTKYIISISNVNDEYIINIPSCLGFHQCHFPLRLEVQSHVRCNATNEIGMDTTEIVTAPGSQLATQELTTEFTSTYEGSRTPELTTIKRRTNQDPCGLSGDVIAKITIGIILLIVLIVLILICIFVIRVRQRGDKADSMGNKTPPGSRETNVSRVYMELNAQTREKERVYEEPTERDPELLPHGTKSHVHTGLQRNENTEYEVFQEIGEESNNDQLHEYINVQAQ